MKYRVLWDDDAFHNLRRAWIAANEPEAGIRAFDAIEQALSVDAHLQGESRDQGVRILIEPPIGVIFDARQDVGEVLVVAAWMFATRK